MEKGETPPTQLSGEKEYPQRLYLFHRSPSPLTVAEPSGRKGFYGDVLRAPCEREVRACIIDVVAEGSFSKCKNVLKPDGIYVTTIYGLRPILRKFWTSITGMRMHDLILKETPYGFH